MAKAIDETISSHILVPPLCRVRFLVLQKALLALNLSFFQIKQANFAVILNKYDPNFANFRSKIKEIEDKIKDVRNVGCMGTEAPIPQSKMDFFSFYVSLNEEKRLFLEPVSKSPNQLIFERFFAQIVKTDPKNNHLKILKQVLKTTLLLRSL